VLALVTAWGLRLAMHILIRNWGRGEDFRYRRWRQAAGSSWWWRSYIKVFLLQGTVMWIVALPLVATVASPVSRPLERAGLAGSVAEPGVLRETEAVPAATGRLGTLETDPAAARDGRAPFDERERAARTPALGWLDLFGAGVWLVGFLFEAIGDWQLVVFKARPENTGRLMTSGLWRYTRHPNYFGDATVWWGHYLVAAAGGAWWSVASPIVMTVLLVRVSGVAMLDAALADTKPGYREYMATTSAFIPRPPRRPRK
jgi:steroid 5-alpha reductase family enzyme